MNHAEQGYIQYSEELCGWLAGWLASDLFFRSLASNVELLGCAGQTVSPGEISLQRTLSAVSLPCAPVAYLYLRVEGKGPLCR